MLTTFDNPHDPFDEFTPWYDWDVQAGYHTSAFLSRLVYSSDALSEADQQLAIENAIDDVVSENVNGMYRKVTKEIPD